MSSSPRTPFASPAVLRGLELAIKAAEESQFTVEEQQAIDRAIAWLEHARALRSPSKAAKTIQGEPDDRTNDHRP